MNAHREIGRHLTMAFSCGARSAFNREEQGYLRTTLSRRQLQALLGRVPERNTHRVSLIGPPVVFEPTCRVTPFRVVVRPVDHTALFVPHVLTVEAYAIAFL